MRKLILVLLLAVFPAVSVYGGAARLGAKASSKVLKKSAHVGKAVGKAAIKVLY